MLDKDFRAMLHVTSLSFNWYYLYQSVFSSNQSGFSDEEFADLGAQLTQEAVALVEA